MKEKEAAVDCPEHRMVLFVEKEDGSFGATVTGSYLTRNYLDDYKDKHRRLYDQYERKMAANEISPVAYYIVRREMSVADLAARVGLSVRKVRRHMDPRHFGEVTVSQARSYAEVFNVPVAQLFEIVKGIDSQNPELPKRYIALGKTANPYVVTAEIVG